MLSFLTVMTGLMTLILAFWIATDEMDRRHRYYAAKLHTVFVSVETKMTHQLYRTYYTIGRQRRQADLAVDFCNDPSISRVHAILWYDLKGNQFCIKPAPKHKTFFSKPTYPTVYVNNKPIPNSGVPLRNGDMIRLGQSHFILQDSEV